MQAAYLVSLVLFWGWQLELLQLERAGQPPGGLSG